MEWTDQQVTLCLFKILDETDLCVKFLIFKCNLISKDGHRASKRDA